MFLFLLFIPVFTYAYFAKDLTTKDIIMNRNDTGVTILDQNDRPFFTFYQAKNKEFVPLNDIPKYTQETVISTEDRDFYFHPGFSIRGIIRSFIENIRQRSIVYGGSTITQQLVKNVLLNPSKSFLRKYQEIVLAQEIERRYKKNEILEMYLNSVYFGEGAFGIEDAAQVYFGKKAKDLTLAQSSLLAGLLPAPSYLSPLSGNRAEAINRQKIVLEKMLEQKYITKDQKYKAENEKLVFRSPKEGINEFAPHFALMVKDELVNKFGEEYISRSGFRIKTSLNLDWQEYAEKVVSDQVDKLAPNRVTNGAAVVMDPKTGEIKALVGSKNWHDSKFGKVNIAISLRQPGSAFKPIVYASAFERHLITPATILKDQPITYPGNYSPKNFDRKFRGQVTVRRALANSLNVPSVQIMSKVDIPDAIEMATRLGITTLDDPSNYGLSLVLGAAEVKPLELTNVYGTFANQGIKNTPTAILEIQDKRGQIVYKYHPQNKEVLDPKYSFLISSILSDNKARAEEFGNLLDISKPAAVKTGTSEDFRDSWTVGYTPSLVIGAWVGNNDNSPMDNIAGSLGAAPIWKDLMERFLSDKPIENFVKPPGIIAIPYVCVPFKISTPSSSMEFFVKGTEPNKDCTLQSPTIVRPTTSTNPVSATPLPTVSPIPSSPTVAPSLSPTHPIPTHTFVPSNTHIRSNTHRNKRSFKLDSFLTEFLPFFKVTLTAQEHNDYKNYMEKILTSTNIYESIKKSSNLQI